MEIAVIIMTYNRPDALTAVLEAYTAQNDKDFELIIADDGSTDETRQPSPATRQRASWILSTSGMNTRGSRRQKRRVSGLRPCGPFLPSPRTIF